MGLEANQALEDRQEALAQLRAEAAQNREEVKEAMAKVRAEGRAASAPAAPSRRLRADLDAGVHPRAAKKAHAVHGQENPDKWDQDDMGDVPEPPKPRKLEPKRHRVGYLRSERRRQDEARKKENEAKMSEMSGERTPLWVHDRYEKSETESVAASGEDDLVNRLDLLKNDPAVRHKLDKVLQEACEEVYGETLDLDHPEMVESDVEPMVDEPAPGMEDVVHHWEIAQKTLMPFKELHEKSRSPARQPKDSRADSAQASKGKGKVTAGAKRFLTRAVLEAARDVGRRAKKLKPTEEEKEKEKEASPGSTHMEVELRLQP